MRPRRLRNSKAIRALIRETHLAPSDFIQPLFVMDGNGAAQDIASLPGQQRLNLDDLVKEAARCYQLGVPGIAIFPALDASLKTAGGEEALNPETLVLRAIRALKQELPELFVMTDIALDPYTNHGHDGVLNAAGTDVANDRTVDILRQMAVLAADAGVDAVAPSDMMDGRIGAIRDALDFEEHTGTQIIAYSAKFNSAFYGPFRDAVGSSKAAGTRLLGKQTYQLDPANHRQAATEIELDEAEGADVVMVKPAGPYLDIIRQTRELTNLPVAAYQVSGEYAQLHAAAEKGWLELKRTRDESLLAIKRAGADIILSYFASEWAEENG